MMKRRTVESWVGAKGLASCTLLVCLLPVGTAMGEPSGAEIYRTLCLECHGPQGEGVAGKYDETLHGDLSVEELARRIEETMPEEQPELCVGDEARAVASYIHETFYSHVARAQIMPVRVDLSRMTVKQYVNSVADLVGSFREERDRAEPSGEQGLQGDYYKTHNMRRNEAVFERIDPAIAFQFGEGSPDSEQIGAEEFSMRWRGGLTAPETGDYEFCLKTENGARLWVNGEDTPLIDGWVSSGAEPREERGVVRLLEGRVYPVRIEYFKFKDKTASLEFRWKPPHRPEELVPSTVLSPGRVPEIMVVTTEFPPDDSSAGYERGTSVSQAWHNATTRAAVEVAVHVEKNVRELSGVSGEESDRAAGLQDFAVRFVERAFRRPMSPEDKRFFVAERFAETPEDPDLALKRTILLALKSPRFLYLEAGRAEPDSFDVASRLSYALWDSLPDAELVKAARAGALDSPVEIENHARRMLDDPRTHAKVRGFFHHWLNMEEGEDVTRDPETFPGFDQALLADLRESLEQFLDHVIWKGSGDFRELLLADYLFLNGRLARYYGVETAEEERFEKVAFDPAQRAGVITHPYLLTAFSYHKSSSPIHRGVFLTRKVLGRALKPPPMAIEFMDSRFDPSLTMREKVAELTKSENCMGCHSVINPLGFSLEYFDAVGRFRTEENGKPVDAASDYATLAGEILRLQGPRDVAEHAAASAPSREGFIQQLFAHVVKQPIAAYGQETAERLGVSFEASECNIRELVVNMAAVAARHELPENRKLAHHENP